MDEFGNPTDDFGGLDTSGGFDSSNLDAATGTFSNDQGVTSMDWANLLNNAASMTVGSGQTGPGTTIGGMSGATQLVGMGAMARGAAMLSGPFIAALQKLAQVLGVSGGASPLSYARRVYGMLATWAAKNPGMSMVSLLVSLGLSVEEAAHFIGWGATHRKKRRSRGLSYRDIRTTRRTIRKITSMTRGINALCHSIPHRRKHA